MNLCTQDPDARAFAAQVLTEDLGRTALLPGCLYNFHPGSHVGQGLEEGFVRLPRPWKGLWLPRPKPAFYWRPWRARELKSAAGSRSFG